MRAMSGLRRALGEPLLHFIVMGALLTAADARQLEGC
jgi:hypothetical protein